MKSNNRYKLTLRLSDQARMDRKLASIGVVPNEESRNELAYKIIHDFLGRQGVKNHTSERENFLA